MSTHKKGTFTTSDGQLVLLRGISPWLIDGLSGGLEKEWAAAGRAKPAAPTYTIELPGGETETHVHDETTLKTDEDRAAWAAYLQARANWDNAMQDRLMRVICMEGVVTRPADDKWIARQKFLGIAVPDDPLEREVHWVQTSLLRSADDVQGVMTAVLALSGVSEEALRNAEESFRDKVGQSDGAAAEQPADAERGLVA